jgi:hypothetical protein
MSFDEAVKKLELMMAAAQLNVLVWGAGAGEHHEKRKKVRNEIQAAFRNADVSFSEDMDLSKLLPGISDLSLQNQELWHLAACDACIVLDTSKGSGEEIAHFVRSTFAAKLLILTSEKYKGATSFPAALRASENQMFYTDEEYESCNLVAKVLTHLKTLALSKFGYGSL